MAAATSADREIFRRISGNAEAAVVIDVLEWEIRNGDAETKKAAKRRLYDYATRAEVSAIMRVLKS